MQSTRGRQYPVTFFYRIPIIHVCTLRIPHKCIAFNKVIKNQIELLFIIIPNSTYSSYSCTHYMPLTSTHLPCCAQHLVLHCRYIGDGTRSDTRICNKPKIILHKGMGIARRLGTCAQRPATGLVH